MAEETRGAQFVVIGASAGGVDALTTLVATLPPDLPAPVVIAQHLDPARPSHMGEILAMHTALPVHVLTDHPRLPLEPGAIYVIPANRHVRISRDELRVEEDHKERPKPSIDLLLASAADVFGEGLVAVILTGRGSDGAMGARAVKTAGGTVVIQDPDTARYPAMPAAVDPTLVDIVADVEHIGPLLRDLLAGDALPQTQARERTLHAFLDELRQRSGIDFSQYKLPTIRRRLQRRMVAAGSENLAAYIRYVQSHPEEYDRLVNSFLIKVTEFFRDPDLYTYLREHVVPELIAQARERGNELRIWSAGCATGQEAYSLAILLAEALGDELDHFTVRIFATDLDAAAIGVARHGVYPAAAVAALPPDLVARYFTRVDGTYAVSKRIRALTVFGEHDLAHRSPFPNIDLCVCRNVLIYFTPELQVHALRLFAFAVRDGGYLVLGKSETPRPLDDLFAPVTPGLKVYRRHGARPAISATLPLPGGAFQPPARVVLPPHARSNAATEPPTGAGLERSLLALPLGVAVVDRRYDIQTINAAARRLLGIHRGGIGEDLIHLVQGLDAAALRTAIDAAFQPDASRGEGAAVGTPRADGVMAARTAAGEMLYLQVACYPYTYTSDARHRNTGGRDRNTVLIAIVDVTRAERERRAHEDAEARAQEARAQEAAGYRDEMARLSRQLEGLTADNRDLLAANAEMIATNAELGALYDEAVVRAEEAQAATEEVETLNEELQASNEELETLNEELQATVEELDTTNAELRVRGVELEEQAAALAEQAAALAEQRAVSEAERTRLTAILAHMADAVLVVDPEGNPVLTNAAYARLFGAEDALTAQDGEGRPLPPETTPRRRAARGEEFGLQFTAIVADGSRRWFEATGRPVRVDGGLHWSVVVIRDITERTQRRLQDEFLAMASHELRTPLTPIQGYLELLARLLRAEGDHDQERRYTTLVQGQVERLKGLVDDLLDVGRLESGKFILDLEPLDLVPLVERAIEAMRLGAEAQGQTIALAAPDGPVWVRGDAGRLEQVVLNLLTNAITYAPASPRIEVQLAREGDLATLTVRDEGPGIPEAALPRLFDRFYQASRLDGPSRQGLGLGLFLTRELVTAHGGTIEVQSAPGAGAAFTVRLPLLPSS